MRRVFSSLLVALFSFSLIAPAVVTSNTSAKLPACCLRDGKHHCGLASHAQVPAGPSVAAARCPLFPVASAVPASQAAGLPGISRVIPSGLLRYRVSLSRVEGLSRISYSQAGQKRGPPVFFS
jgi:hypothetical protein